MEPTSLTSQHRRSFIAAAVEENKQALGKKAVAAVIQ